MGTSARRRAWDRSTFAYREGAESGASDMLQSESLRQTEVADFSLEN
jgi:hypothetical protein